MTIHKTTHITINSIINLFTIEFAQRGTHAVVGVATLDNSMIIYKTNYMTINSRIKLQLNLISLQLIFLSAGRMLLWALQPWTPLFTLLDIKYPDHHHHCHVDTC